MKWFAFSLLFAGVGLFTMSAAAQSEAVPSDWINAGVSLLANQGLAVVLTLGGAAWILIRLDRKLDRMLTLLERLGPPQK